MKFGLISSYAERLLRAEDATTTSQSPIECPCGLKAASGIFKDPPIPQRNVIKKAVENFAIVIKHLIMAEA